MASKIQIIFQSDANYVTSDVINLSEDFASFVEEFDGESDPKSIVVTKVNDGEVKLNDEQRREIARQYIDEMKLMDGIAFVLEINGVA